MTQSHVANTPGITITLQDSTHRTNISLMIYLRNLSKTGKGGGEPLENKYGSIFRSQPLTIEQKF